MQRRITGVSLRHMAGITLIELMIVVAVIALLSMIAVPSYRQYVMRAQRTEAKSALLQLQTNQERFYLANRTYGSMDALIAADLATGTSERGTYTLTIEGANTNGYTARAEPADGAEINMTRDDQCQSFAITAQGERSATGTAADTCW